MNDMMNTMPQAGVLKKPVRDKCRVEHILAFKPPIVKNLGDNDAAPFLVYVSESGDEKQALCKVGIWQEVDGNPRPGQRPRGLDFMKKSEFLLYFDPEKKDGHDVVVSLDQIPADALANNKSRGLPEGQEDVETITLRVAPHGGYTVVQAPYWTRFLNFLDLFRRLNKHAELQPGLDLGGGREVRNVAGNLVECVVPREDQQVEHFGTAAAPQPVDVQ